MTQFILTNILMLSFGGMLYLAARALPRLEEEAQRKPGIFDRLVKSGVTEELDAALKGVTVKFLRKSKVYLLKVENSITARLKNMMPENGGSEGKQIDFKEILEDKEGKE